MGKKLLDLFCGAGGCAAGYAAAGFEVTGVDIQPQPHYPFRFIQADALHVPLDGFDVVHASPPCQAYSICQNFLRRPGAYPDLLPAVRQRLESWGGVWIIENVPGAPLPEAVALCGSMFGLPVRRHRWFSSSQLLFAPGPCRHGKGSINPIGGKVRGYGTLASHRTYRDAKGARRKREAYLPLAAGQAAMGIDWMTLAELSQAIPPAYTAWIGRQLLCYC